MSFNKGFALWALVVIVALAAGGLFWFLKSPVQINNGTSAATSTDVGQGIAVYKSGISGNVVLGPTCPVERTPPDPQCADKPYQTLVAIFRASDPVHAVVLTQSDAQGKFTASLPPGDYTVGAGESNLPHCAVQEVTVGPTSYTPVTVTCDTGIR